MNLADAKIIYPSAVDLLNAEMAFIGLELDAFNRIKVFEEASDTKHPNLTFQCADDEARLALTIHLKSNRLDFYEEVEYKNATY